MQMCGADVGGLHRGIFFHVLVCLLLLGLPGQFRVVHLPSAGVELLAEANTLQARSAVFTG